MADVEMSDSPPRTVEGLVEAAASHLSEMPPQVEEAQAFFEEALALDPNNADVLDVFGAFLCEEGDTARATELLARCVQLRPNVGPEKFLYLAQMHDGEAALGHYQRGIEVLRTAAAVAEGSVDAATCRRQLARTLASVAELYMTDLCDGPDAEAKCEAAIASGAEADSECLQLMCTTASLRKVQCRMEEASQTALKVAARVLTTLEEEQNAPIMEQNEAEEVTLGDEELIQLIRLLIDLTNTVEARGLLEKLLHRDEEDIQVWCLLGYCHVVEKDIDAVRECVGEAVKLCKKMSKAKAAYWKPNLKDLMTRMKHLEASTPKVPMDIAGAACA